ncbi:low-specificity L-threonine aldolase 1 [Fagus crenata]
MITRTVGLRSDTVTKPTETMQAAMATADFDDDVLGYDPTALCLETEMARITGKEAALFIPSSTMGNLIIIVGYNSHIHIYQIGGISTIGGVHLRTVKNNQDGTMHIDLIKAAIMDQSKVLVDTITSLICLENTHANCGSRCLSVQYTDTVGEVAKKHGLKLHINGACIFIASVVLVCQALGIPVHRLLQAADSALVCLSKGLGAPVESVIVGSKSFIAKVLILNQTRGIRVDAASVETNISSKITAEDLCNYLEEHELRIVLHHQISESDVQYTSSCFQQALTGLVEDQNVI